MSFFVAGNWELTAKLSVIREMEFAWELGMTVIQGSKLVGAKVLNAPKNLEFAPKNLTQEQIIAPPRFL